MTRQNCILCHASVPSHDYPAHVDWCADHIEREAKRIAERRQARKQTPWGKPDAIDEVGEGIFFASTPSHGGYFVPTAKLSAIPDAHQARALRWSGSQNWYEEDCEWASVALAFPHLFNESQREAAAATMKWRATRE